MSDHPSPGAPSKPDTLRQLSRTPKPYSHNTSALPYSSGRFLVRDKNSAVSSQSQFRNNAATTTNTDSSPVSESGTEADDEHFLKGLPAPRSRHHKGLREQDDIASGTSTTISSPTEGIQDTTAPGRQQQKLVPQSKPQGLMKYLRQHKNVAQRTTEVGIVVSLGLMVRNNQQVKPLIDIWAQDHKYIGLLYASLLSVYPLRVAAWEYRHGKPSTFLPFKVPVDFEPAPFLYPPPLTIFVSLLVATATENSAFILPNIILSICSWPQQIIPRFGPNAPYDSIHWALTCLPLAWYPRAASSFTVMSAEDMTLLYPLHQILCVLLHHLTTTSLLTAELQLFSMALINILLLASSPQIQILKALLWVGGLAVLMLCGSVIRSAIVLARVPRWRFRRSSNHKSQPFLKRLIKMLPGGTAKSDTLGSTLVFDSDSGSSSDGKRDYSSHALGRVQTCSPEVDRSKHAKLGSGANDLKPRKISRRYTLSSTEAPSSPWQTPSGRKKRGVSMSSRPFLKLTYTQAVVRKWAYALYVYLVLAAVILIGVRGYISNFALDGTEPIGFALAYMLGDLRPFRFRVVAANLEGWIPLPPRSETQCRLGWIQHLRHDGFGEANTRLLITGYWLCVFVMGLAVVFRLKEIFEVDTRRKVFHFMMVGILLPATFIDPAFCALALSLALAIFLILDLLRASQLPPLSKPIASFLAPYVDGRDFRGPVVISHIFLLIGCAIPLWLALAALPRSATNYLPGWEVPTRDVSMVSGVVCVGLGDAAASLIGRRYGRRKWIWGGGKSLEGSLAFALAVFLGLQAASLWLRFGGWSVAGENVGGLVSARNSGVCGALTSLTEAVLTGGNDNVIVPIVLWTCVKSLSV